MGRDKNKPEQGSKVVTDLITKAGRSNHAVEVEDLLNVAVEGVPPDAPLLRSVKDMYQWPDVNENEDGSPRVVPLGRWADVVIAYLEGGVPRLKELALSSAARYASFPLAVLEEIGSVESIQGVADVAVQALASTPVRQELACLCAKALNLQVGLPTSIEVPEGVAVKVRGLLHDMLGMKLLPKDLATVCCALRGVGNEESLALLSNLPPFEPPWEGSERLAALAIQKKLKR